MKQKATWFIFIVSLLTIPIFFLLASNKRPQLPVYGAIAHFSLTERSGKTVSLDDLKGKTWIADFIFTRCGGQCPMMSRQMSELQKKLPSSILFVSFTVDPEWDTPQVLLEYAKNYSAEEGKWLFLTGPKEILTQITQSCYMHDLEDPNMHSLRFVLVDPQAQIRGYYDGTDGQAMQKLEKDSRILTITNVF